MSNPRDQGAVAHRCRRWTRVATYSGSAGCCHRGRRRSRCKRSRGQVDHHFGDLLGHPDTSFPEPHRHRSHLLSRARAFDVSSSDQTLARNLLEADDDRHGGLFGATQAADWRRADAHIRAPPNASSEPPATRPYRHGGRDAPIATQPSISRVGARRRHPPGRSMAAPSGPLRARPRRRLRDRTRRESVVGWSWTAAVVGVWPVLNVRPDDDHRAPGSNCGNIVGKECAHGPDELLTHHASAQSLPPAGQRRPRQGPWVSASPAVRRYRRSHDAVRLPARFGRPA
jgi:hypothetical protein